MPSPLRVVLNILSMRSVIRNPLTMFVMDANSATAPMKRMIGGWSDPVTMIEPTTAIADALAELQFCETPKERTPAFVLLAADPNLDAGNVSDVY